MNFKDQFKKLTGHAPFPYQARLAGEPWPELLSIPTGLGKTQAVIGAWLHKRLNGDEQTGRRLVYCLPMRVLVRQTQQVAEAMCQRAEEIFQESGRAAPSVHVLLGGDVDNTWDADPAAEAIIIGTQDMLLSRALNRGYAVSRYRWPMHFGLLSSDVVWVFDETQLMGVGVETSAQLDGLRGSIGVHNGARSVWMSATLAEEHLNTVDHRRPAQGFTRLTLDQADNDNAVVQTRTGAYKRVEQVTGVVLDETSVTGPGATSYISALAAHVARTHTTQGDLTLVVVNRVSRAQELFSLLKEQLDDNVRVGLIHSRYRPGDRIEQERVLTDEGPRIVVATQVVEAGVDVSAKTLITELCPWSSLVQRFGRCNRYGEYDTGASVHWVDADVDALIDAKKTAALLPYEADALLQSRAHLLALQEAGRGAGPTELEAIEYLEDRDVRPVLRRRDLLALFDTSTDLSGEDLDVSRFVRDDSDPDVFVYWTDFDDVMRSPRRNTPLVAEPNRPERDALCRVGLAAARSFLAVLEKQRKKLAERSAKGAKELADRHRALIWDSLHRRWEVANSRTVRPGNTLAFDAVAGGYTAALGWIGSAKNPERVPDVATAIDAESSEESHDDNLRSSDIGKWVLLEHHLAHVRDEARRFAEAVGLSPELCAKLATAGLWHDVGKAHREFQGRLLDSVAGPERPAPRGSGLWAKSNHNRRSKRESHRRYFRHELASMLTYLDQSGEQDERTRDLVAYLVLAHHGKVRVSLRSLPDERPPGDEDRLLAHGVLDGERIERVTIPDVGDLNDVEMDLSLMQIGESSSGAESWLERVLSLRDDPDLGPFRLAFLETLLRVADWKASNKEQHEGYYDE